MAHGPITAGTPDASNNNTVTPANPTHASGDTLLCVAFVRSDTATLACATAGWTAADGITNPVALGTSARAYFFQNECDSASESDPAVTISGGANGVTVMAVVLRLEDRDTAANFVLGTVSDNAASVTTIAFGQDSPSIDNGNAILALGFHHDDYAVAPTFDGQTAGLTWTENVNFETTLGADASMFIFSAINDSGSAYTAGTAAALSGTWSNSASNWGVYLESVGVSNSFSQAPGISLETDTSLQLGLAHAANFAAETNAGLALTATQIIATGVALETATALALSMGTSIDVGLTTETDTAVSCSALIIHGIGAQLVSNGHFDKDTAGWTKGTLGTMEAVAGRLRLTTDAGSGNDVFADFGPITTISGLYYTVAAEIYVTPEVTIPEALFRGGATQGGITYFNDTISPPGEPSGNYAYGFRASAAELYLRLYALGNAAGQVGEFDNVSVRQVSGETNTAQPLGIATGLQLVAEVNAALSLTAVTVLALGLSIETDIALASTSVLVEDTGLTAEIDTSLALGLAQGLGLAAETDTALELYNTAVGLANETDIAVALGVALGVERADEFDGSGTFAPLIVINTGAGVEADTVLSLGLTLGVTRADETDAAFAVGTALPVDVAVETSTAFVLGHRLIGVTGFSAETNIAYARTLALNTAFASELDAALSLSFALARLVGRAEETDTAIELARNLAVLPGYKPDVDLRWLDDVRQLVHRATNKPTAGRFGDPTPEVQIGVLKPPTRRLDDPTPPVHDNSRYD